jgi:transposase-like protein
MASVLNEAYFHDEAAAFAALEGIMWPNGPVCPHCGGMDRLGKLEGVKDKKGRIRLGLWKCYQAECRQQFTVRKGTVFEASHLKLHQWFQCTYLLCSSKKGVSSHQLSRTLGCTVKTAWFASHRIREAMRDGSLDPLGGEGKIIEADETYIANSEKSRRIVPGKRTANRGPHYKRKVLALVERGGKLRTFHIETVTSAEVGKIVLANVARESAFMTDEGRHYRKIGQQFASHDRVHHQAKEYVRGDAHVNTLEGVFSIFKRGMVGVYQHCGEHHLHRYLAEFDFRYNNRIAAGVNDQGRTVNALVGARGKRLTYRDSPKA